MFLSNTCYIETIAREFIKLDNTILCIIKKTKKNQRADIDRIFDEVTKTTDFQHITMGALSGRVNEILQSKKIMSKLLQRIIFLERICDEHVKYRCQI